MLCPWLFSETNFGTKNFYLWNSVKEVGHDRQKYFHQFGMTDEESDFNELEELL